MGTILLIINSIFLFIDSNIYLLLSSKIINIPIWTLLFISPILTTAFVLMNIFPSLLCKKLYDKNLNRIRNGYRLLILFLTNIIYSSILYIILFFKYHIDIKLLLINLLVLVPILAFIFWNGMIRAYLFSRQLGVRYRLIGFILGLVPIAHIIMLIKIISVCHKEVIYENKKEKINLDRKDKEVCKTKYPILLVHGIFFRDYEKINYWGRIPEELIKNGATIYYGNHSSSLAVKDSAKELADRIKTIVKETGCKKVNIIAHSKGGLDSRYAISNLGMDKYVASLSMINTPNHGCIFADYLLNKAPDKLKKRVSSAYNFTLKKLGDKSPDFIAGVTDLTSPVTEKLNKEMKHSDKVYYRAYGSILKKFTSGRFPLNLTNKYVGLYDGKNDGLVGIDSFPYNGECTIIESNDNRGISHGDVVDLNRENFKGFDVREFYVSLVNELKEKGF